MVGNEPCLSEKQSVYRQHLEAIQDNCNMLNELIDSDIKLTNERLKSTRSMQEQINKDIMEYVK